MKRISLLPNALTAFSLSCGLLVIFKMCLLPQEEVSYALLLQTSLLLLMAGIADLLDGAVARAIKAESHFGGFFDSMADAVSFGVAPAVMVLKSLPYSHLGTPFFLITLGALVYSVCGVLRLVRYNVMGLTLKMDESANNSGSGFFIGLPIPAAAALIVTSALFISSPEIELFGSIPNEARLFSLTALFILIGYLMVSRIRFPSLKNLRIRVASFSVVFATSAIILVLLLSFLHHYALAFFIGAWGYLVLSLGAALVRGIKSFKGRGAKGQ